MTQAESWTPDDSWSPADSGVGDGALRGPPFASPDAGPSGPTPGASSPWSNAPTPSGPADPSASQSPFPTTRDPYTAVGSAGAYAYGAGSSATTGKGNQALPAYEPYPVAGFAPGPGYGSLYGTPYGSYGAYGYAAPRKSKAVGALLAFFLGGIGAHNFYLGQNVRGLSHIGLGILGFAGMMAGVIISESTQNSGMILLLLGMLCYMANGLWAFIEFIVILITPESDLGQR